MEYLITFIEGILSFISPCMLPMLPVYISYFVGGPEDGSSRSGYEALANAVFFVIGFTVVFTSLGLFSGILGRALAEYKTLVNIVCGAVMVLFGLSYLGLFHIPIFTGIKRDLKITGFASSLVFGIIYSVSLTPCVGAFLGSALLIASSTGGALKGSSLLLVYSLGMGIPFILSAVLLEKLGSAFAFIKRHYRIINIVSGGLLIAVGILMALGWLTRFLSISVR